MAPVMATEKTSPRLPSCQARWM
uniref:Uncharacterized protein n=1 Tax=Arundo donax TaxID=35708 RepID=A0A0A9EG35_ARUDO